MFVAVKNLEPMARGRCFEKILVTMLRRDDIEAQYNPGAAHPWQTDAAFLVENTLFLVEAKWQATPAQIGDLGSLRTRIQRCPVGTAGCLVSMEGFSAPLVEDLREHREQEIVLLSGDEVRRVVLGDSLAALLAEKRRRFRLDGQIWFAADDERSRRPIALPPCRYSIHQTATELRSIPLLRDDIQQVHYLLGLLEVGPPTILLELVAAATDVDDLARILSTLHQGLALGDEGSFAIHQTCDAWFGFGAARFLDELRAVEQRCASRHSAYLHHSEDASFACPFEAGLVLVSTRQRLAKRSEELHSTRITVVMDGIPLNLEPLRSIAREIDGTDARLRIGRPGIDPEHRTLWLNDGPTVDVVAYLHGRHRDEGDEWVEGIVAKNPYKGRSSDLERLTGDVSLARALAETDQIVCRLRSQHGVSDKVNAYRVRFLKWWPIDQVELVTIGVDWDQIECHCRHDPTCDNSHYRDHLASSEAKARVRKAIRTPRPKPRRERRS